MNTRLRKNRWLAAFTGAALGLALGGGALVALRTEIRHARYSLAEIDAETRETRNQIERLRRQRQTLASPSYIRRRAREIGMEEATPQAFVRVGAFEDAAPGQEPAR